MVDLTELNALGEWPKVRGAIETAVRCAIGHLPRERNELQVKTLDEDFYAGYVRKRINYFVDDWTRVSAWLFEPDHRDEAPAVLCCHRRVEQGKDEPAGAHGDPRHALAQRLAEQGYVVIAPDCICAGERITPGHAAYNTEVFYKDHPKMSALGKMLHDHMHALDVLCEVRAVDPERLGVVGEGLGGVNALMLAAFDDRVQACAALDAFTRFEGDERARRWYDDDGFAICPKLRESIDGGELAFDWEHVLAMIAPSPALVAYAPNACAGSNPESVPVAVARAGRVYELLGKAEALALNAYDPIADPLLDMTEIVNDWFERWL